MKVAVLCHASAGGSGVVATELGLQVARAGHEVHFVGSAQPFRLGGHGGMRGPYFHQVSAYAYALFDQPYPELAAANTLTEVILEQGVELSHAHYAIPHATAAIHARAITGRSRVMTTLHGTDVTLVGLEPAFRHTTRHAIEKSDHVTAVSSYLAQHTQEVFGVEREIEVIHNFVDSERFVRVTDPAVRARFAHPDEALLVHVSNFRPVKRPEDVVQVFARVASEIPARLLMIGDGPERPRVFELAQQLGVIGRTHFLGSFPDVETVLGISDLFLLPSRQESFGLAALEAMSCEVPVVSSNAGGIPEVVEQGVTGFMADVGDVDTMADAALRILRNRELYLQMGAAGRAAAVGRFHPSLIVPQYIRAYERTALGVTS
ncbi:MULTISPECIES: N-acetyl-alpha-D-glucosaminyl L-malate synthase BshA [unclassified Deinococcus]|uniref:N-acetyl-alpha-D-glucosaminyl L-malate synthase BshA n=1 Tax=unclassified Deinococcus TaxID=2623546 RepID=UPI000C17F00E|nr:MULTISPECIES: N-acetyl-alpha-D-glucosaminyl L-malate synthase BshA [unclassified Deinococcus]MBX8464587.1 N-acetyl-alpha-D-glucosaminyl L-malate synthase BshA [Deinococcus sp. RIT780]MCD0157097.1 N-acetyl-alpha-D-glucosaminyl L-malate synthase BshA [Deinococcus sp. 6GRE01]MCD0161074.1 N-acetyl-alpha-D-glucosaminyl L-malate synthase BshA [Deinococcus sp. 6YEL10]MCD0166248.1 N-acetyl-alpha-D-glucosaminyl L-malate synthase BshA [Deinococcus sp. 12RED42]MCD0170428.1 N-acetyl-alpha-D-glucosaminy